MVQRFNPPKRDQLTKVTGNDDQLLRAFEALFRQSGQDLPEMVDVYDAFNSIVDARIDALRGEIADELTRIPPPQVSGEETDGDLRPAFVQLPFKDLDGLAIFDAADGQGIAYNATSGLWEPIDFPVISGATGTFTDNDGNTVTVTNGLITALS